MSSLCYGKSEVSSLALLFLQTSLFKVTVLMSIDDFAFQPGPLPLFIDVLSTYPPWPATFVSVPLEAADAINAISPATHAVNCPIFILSI